jgi:hypothetical protein
LKTNEVGGTRLCLVTDKDWEYWQPCIIESVGLSSIKPFYMDAPAKKMHRHVVLVRKVDVESDTNIVTLSNDSEQYKVHDGYAVIVPYPCKINKDNDVVGCVSVATAASRHLDLEAPTFRDHCTPWSLLIALGSAESLTVPPFPTAHRTMEPRMFEGVWRVPIVGQVQPKASWDGKDRLATTKMWTSADVEFHKMVTAHLRPGVDFSLTFNTFTIRCMAEMAWFKYFPASSVATAETRRDYTDVDLELIIGSEDDTKTMDQSDPQPLCAKRLRCGKKKRRANAVSEA